MNKVAFQNDVLFVYNHNLVNKRKFAKAMLVGNCFLLVFCLFVCPFIPVNLISAEAAVKILNTDNRLGLDFCGVLCFLEQI